MRVPLSVLQKVDLAYDDSRLDVHVEGLLGRRLVLKIESNDLAVFLLKLWVAKDVLTLNCLERLVFLRFLSRHFLDRGSVRQDFDRAG